MKSLTVEIILVLIFALGVMVMYMPEISIITGRAVQGAVRWIREMPRKAEERNRETVPEGLNEEIIHLLQITMDSGSKRALAVFWTISAAGPAAFFAIMREKLEPALIMAVCAFLGAMPAILLAGRLKKMRVKNSKEGKILLSELIDNYKINYFNMQQAVEITAMTIEEAPNCKRLLFNLSKGLNRAGSSGEIRKLLEDFKFSIGTSWASILADNMFFALSSGIKVTAAMEDLLQTVAKAEKIEEYARRDNNESVLILKYMAPICYLLTVIGGIKYFGLTTGEFVKFQFGTEAGLAWFTVSVLTYAAALVIKEFLTKSKLDL